MLKLLLFLGALLIGVGSIAQEKIVFQFDNIQEAVYNYNIEKFEAAKETKGIGQIEIHLKDKAVLIDCENDEGDKKLSIIEKNKENDSGEMYICAMDGQYYAFTVAKDATELTLVSADNRYVYKLTK